MSAVVLLFVLAPARGFRSGFCPLDAAVEHFLARDSWFSVCVSITRSWRSSVKAVKALLIFVITRHLGTNGSEDSWEVQRNINARESVWLVRTKLLAHSSAAQRRRGLGSVLLCACFTRRQQKSRQTSSPSIKRAESESAGSAWC